MQTGHPNRSGLMKIAEVAKAFATAALSLALGVTLCLCLLLGGTALAAG